MSSIWGQFYTFTPFVEDSDDVVCSEHLIELALIEIENQATTETKMNGGIGALSANDRNTWNKHFQVLTNENPEAMQIINSAICLVILSDLEPVNEPEQLKWSYVNDGSDMWADKSLSFVAFNNGTIGSQSDVRYNFYIQIGIFGDR